jgi:hypothetical protein
MFRVYEVDAEGFTTFAKYYDSKMEQLITHFKNKLA